MKKFFDTLENVLVDIVVSIIKNRKFIISNLLFWGVGLIIGVLLATAEAKTEAEATTQVYKTVDIVAAIENNTEKPLFSLGDFTATAYCPCVECCGKTDGITATGTKATAGRTIAVDPDVIPYGTEVIINGHTYTAEDCGGAIVGNSVDIFFNTHEEAQQFGVQEVEIFSSTDIAT